MTTAESRSDRASLPAGGPTSSEKARFQALVANPHDLPNSHKVSDSLYRGAQPTAQGIRRLKKMGIRTVVNLRFSHSDRDVIGEIDIGYVHISVNPRQPREDELVRFLRIVSDPTRTPVFVHCQHGTDRTGLMCSVYRVAVQGWTKKAALREMCECKFGFRRIWVGLCLQKLDIERIKARTGLDGLSAVEGLGRFVSAR